MLELQQFDGTSKDEIIARLEQLGYERYAEKPAKASSAPQDVFMFRKREGGPIVKFSTHRHLSETFAALCREHHDNPFFPRILADRNAGNGIHMTVIEELRTADELGGVQPGIARAFATLPDRSRDDHADVYDYLLADRQAQPWLPRAVRAIAEKLLQAFHAGAAALDYNAKAEESDMAGPSSILFRTNAQDGKRDVMPGAQPVFAAPFRQAGGDAETAENRIRMICAHAGVPFTRA